MKKDHVAWASGFVIAALALPAAAQSSMSSFYVGASLGRATAVDSCKLGPPPCESNRDTAFRFFAGYQVNRFLAAELGIGAFGKARVGGSDIKSDAADLVAVATVPLSRSFSALGKLGAYHGSTKGLGIEERKWGATFGAGLQYEPSSQFALRGEWQRYASMAGGAFANTISVDVLSLGLLIRF